MNFFFFVSENKTFEFEIFRRSDLDWLELGTTLQYTRRSDHAGICLSINLILWDIHVSIRDNRHWNDETNSFHTKESWDQYCREEFGGTEEELKLQREAKEKIKDGRETF